MKKELPNRKHPRLDGFDYSSSGAYFITICTQNRRCLLSHIVGRGLAPAEEKTKQTELKDNIWRGLAPAEEKTEQTELKDNIWRGLAPAEKACEQIKYTKFGKIAEQQLFLLEERYKNLTIDKYVIMPNHIHVIFVLDEENAKEAAGASPRPTIMDIVCSYKSLTTRECRRNGFADKLFQTSFYEHIIRGQKDYENIANYIYENPFKWANDELYEEMQTEF